MQLEGKTALVTGGGSGIGEAIARRLVAEGARVCITGRRGEMLDAVVGSLPPGGALACEGDVAKDEDVARMVAASVEFGGGSIISIASVGGIRCMPESPAYDASKAGLIMLTQQAALDYGAAGIRANVICPGPIRTPMMDEHFGEMGRSLGYDADAFYGQVSEALPLRRFGEPREIAAVCAFLAGDDSSFMTGAVLVADGGVAIVDALGSTIGAAMNGPQPGQQRPPM